MTPTQLGRYRIVRVLGRGGMGVVYEGYDPQIDRPVAIKTIALESLSEEEAAHFESRFRVEMRSAGRLQHQNIVALYDTGHDAGAAFIVMELVTGQDLKRRISSGEAITVPQAIDITTQLLAALDYAHRRDVVHRDVKPGNVMLQADGQVKLCDFGVARLTDSDATRTQGMVVGSLRYASPEQITGQPVDARSDIYSAAVLAYELLTGQPPFAGRSDVETLHRIAHDEAPGPASVNPAVPAAVDAAVKRAMHKDPAQRFASAAAFAQALGGAAAHGMTATVPIAERRAAPAVVPAPKSKAPMAALVGGVLAVVAVGGWWLTRKPAPPAERLVNVARPGSSPASARPPVASTPPVLASAAGGQLQASVPAAASTPRPTVAAVARPGSSTTAAAASKPAAVKLPPVALEGDWVGQLVCSELYNPRSNTSRLEGFTSKLALEVKGARISWARGGKTSAETVLGAFDSKQHFTAQGEGWEESEKRRSRWLVEAVGKYNPASAPPQIEAQVRLLRISDHSLLRNCSLTAVRP